MSKIFIARIVDCADDFHISLSARVTAAADAEFGFQPSIQKGHGDRQ